MKVCIGNIGSVIGGAKYGMGPAYDKVLTSIFLPLCRVAGRSAGLSNLLKESYND
jgi:hypothetical protein